MAGFDDILNSLHSNAILSDDEMKDVANLRPIIITSRRAFEVPNDYNLVLGCAGDVNSQIVTFRLPKYHEGHNLSQCDKRKIKWKNLTSGAEGDSDLVPKTTTAAETWDVTWEVPPALMTAAGSIEVAITIYDIVEEDQLIGFSWNTPSYKGFSISESFNNVGEDWTDSYLPPKNEILNIDIDTRQIILPVGYNPVVCNFGEIGMSTLYFEINRYLKNIDLKEDANIYVSVSFGDDGSADYRIPADNINFLFKSNIGNSTEKLLLKWDIPEDITNNEFYYTGVFTIAIKVVSEGKRWITSTLSRLTIGPSQLLTDVAEIISRDETVLQKAIENYFILNDFIIDAN